MCFDLLMFWKKEYTCLHIIDFTSSKPIIIWETGCICVDVWVKHINKKSNVFFKKNNAFSIIQVFLQATTEIVHFNPMAFPISEQWSAQSYLQPPFCSWNHVKSAAIAMLRAKQQRKIQRNVFADLQKLLEDKFQGVPLKLTLFLSVFSNPPNLASTVCNIQIFKLGRVACSRFYNHVTIGYNSFMYFKH